MIKITWMNATFSPIEAYGKHIKHNKFIVLILKFLISKSQVLK
ncbi:hypothetical protein [Spiroplasma endosymbiont of Labia minor]